MLKALASRRALLAAIPFAAVPAAASPLPVLRVSDRALKQIAEIDRLFSEWQLAVSEWAEHKLNTPEHEASNKRVAALEDQIDTFTAGVWAAPVSNWSDVAVRARIAEQWQRRAIGLDCAEREEADRRLIEAIRALVGVQALPPSYFTIDTIPALIGALGGHNAVADWCGATVAQVEKWQEREFIPPGWHHRIACEISRRGLRLADGFFYRWG